MYLSYYTCLFVNVLSNEFKGQRIIWKYLEEISGEEQEPTPPDNPLLRMDNVIVTPQAIAYSDETFMGMWEQNLRQVA